MLFYKQSTTFGTVIEVLNFSSALDVIVNKVSKQRQTHLVSRSGPEKIKNKHKISTL